MQNAEFNVAEQHIALAKQEYHFTAGEISLPTSREYHFAEGKILCPVAAACNFLAQLI